VVARSGEVLARLTDPGQVRSADFEASAARRKRGERVLTMALGVLEHSLGSWSR
jgi:hypothetical protein